MACSILSEQVKWQHPKLLQGEIDQTQLVIADALAEAMPFSFLVLGDTDVGAIDGISPGLSEEEIGFSEGFVQQVMEHFGSSRFLLHTGDITYPVGTYQNYLNGFLRPYAPLLSGLPCGFPFGPDYRSESVVFSRPLLPVPGNHDYEDLPALSRWRHQAIRLLCDRLRQTLNIDLGHYGGYGGEAYGQTFLDDLAQIPADRLAAHLSEHYSAVVQTQLLPQSVPELRHCLHYQPGRFTRLPHRYYHFCYGGVDFFALDSNTWNTASDVDGFDYEQLDWLVKGLIASWQKPDSIGRIIYLHHSPYTTEESRWQQPETLWVRRHLRAVFDQVAAALNRSFEEASPLVDLVISGHAHCLEHVRTTATGHADAHLNWVVCGGSGAGLRRQRQGSVDDILEKISLEEISLKEKTQKEYPDPRTRYSERSTQRYTTEIVAKSQWYAGRHRQGHQRRHLHSFLRIDVSPQRRQKFTVCPFLVTRTPKGWQTKSMSPLKTEPEVPPRPVLASFHR